MGRARHIARREGQRGRSSAQGRPHFLVFSTNPNTPITAAASPATLMVGGGPEVAFIAAGGGPEDAFIAAGGAPSLLTDGGDSSQLISALSDQADRVSASASGSSPVGNQCGLLNNRMSPNQSSPCSQHRAGPSDFQTFSESLKSRFSAMSMRYKESITKSTRGWKERWFSRNSSTQDLGSEVRRESSAGIANVTDLMEHQETRENRRNEIASVSNCHQNSLSSGETKEQLAEVAGNLSVTEDSVQAPCAADSASH